MQIYIDGDGCPVIKNTVKIAKSFNLPVTIVKNYNHTINDEYAQVVSVDNHKDSADYYISNMMQKKDLVVTQDYGLGAMALARGGYVITQNGKVINDKNIDLLLQRRHINREMRNKRKKYAPKNKKRTEKLNQHYEQSLIQLLHEIID